MGTKEKDDINSMLLAILENCPEDAYLRMRAGQVIDLQERLHVEETELLRLIQEFQVECRHEAITEVKKYDFAYSSRVGGIGIGGLHVMLGHRCSKCKIFKPRKEGPPFEVCYRCGGDMKFDRHDLYCGDSVHTYKCIACGHEHDAT
ncbi:MAG: hypothetical protein HZC14_03210 [Candidatus Niyogibacteria bacterium]|nr:hypothetical protein [Candidatus Niyogibacteria bacterium]